jgi:hypothetical protein
LSFCRFVTCCFERLPFHDIPFRMGILLYCSWLCYCACCWLSFQYAPLTMASGFTADSPYYVCWILCLLDLAACVSFAYKIPVHHFNNKPLSVNGTMKH